MTPGEWTYSPQRGRPGYCFMAQVWGPDGKSVAQIEPTDDPEEASATARLIAAALNPVRNVLASAKSGQPSKADSVQQSAVFSSNELAVKLLGVLREIEAYHVALISKRKRRNDPAKSWTVRVVRQAIAEAKASSRHEERE